MANKITKISYPTKSFDFVNIFSEKIPSTAKTLYDTVEFFERNTCLDKIELLNEKISMRTSLRNIINLHNKDGIKDILQIKKMIQQIRSEKEILHQSKLPNIKLVKTERNELVLFDGHHSMLAYMYAGRKYLDEVPHLIIVNEEGYVRDEEIYVFFGEHSKKLKISDWKNYAINWQAPKDKQLCKRLQKDMGELFDSFKDYL